MASMSETHTLGRLLDLVAQLEDTAYDFYAKLRERCPDKPEAAELLSDIMDDELLHARVVRDITCSLPDFRRATPVPSDVILRLEQTLGAVLGLDDKLFACSDATCSAIERIESMEFDVVLSLINVPELEYDLTGKYVRNQAVDHTNRVYRLLRSLG
jgi:rubrerythrin